MKNYLRKRSKIFGDDPIVFRTNLYQLIKDQNLELNFSSDIFANEKFVLFIDIKKLDFENTRKNGMLKTCAQRFDWSFFNSIPPFLFPDYQSLIDNEKIRFHFGFIYIEKN